MWMLLNFIQFSIGFKCFPYLLYSLVFTIFILYNIDTNVVKIVYTFYYFQQN